MRSIRLLAVATTVLVLGSACGGDDPPTGNGNENEAPVAAFTAPTNCVAGTACTFTDASTDDAAVTAWNWDFDGNLTTAEATTASANYTFPAAGTAAVRLIVTDAEGLADTVTNNVTVAPVPVENTPPVASFELATACTEGTPCGFHSTSTDPDPDGSIATLAWDFGDLTAPGAGVDVTHTFAQDGTYAVTLTVTDNLGATHSVTEQITVAPAASQDCTTTGTAVDCALTLNTRSTVKFTMVSEQCDFSGNNLTLAGPVTRTIFFNLCNRAPGEEYTVVQADGTTPYVFEAGTVLAIHFVRGTPGPTDPPASDPGIQVDGTSPSWTLNIDDGGLAGTAGEPDFNDAVISVQATAAP